MENMFNITYLTFACYHVDGKKIMFTVYSTVQNGVFVDVVQMILQIHDLSDGVGEERKNGAITNPSATSLPWTALPNYQVNKDVVFWSFC